MTPKITVNLGVRYELATVLQDANNQLGNFDPNSPTGLVQVGDGITSPYNPDHRDWSPRVGFAWDLLGNQKTVIRAGASMLYEFVPFSAFMNSGGNAVGLGKVPTGAHTLHEWELRAGQRHHRGHHLQPRPVNNVSRVEEQRRHSYLPICRCGVRGWDDDSSQWPLHALSALAQGLALSQPSTVICGRPYVDTWNLDIQRSFTNNLSLDVAYLGNHGVKLYGVQDINAPAVGSGYSAGFLAACAADPTTCQLGTARRSQQAT